MSKGFMNLHRQLLEWEWFDNSQMVHIWIYFLLKANYQDSKWHGIDIPRGSFVTSLDSISKDTRLTIREVRTCIGRLKTTGEVTIKTTNRYSIVTICKYDKYNLSKEDSDKQNDKPNANERQTKDNQSTIDNNIEKDNKEKKEKNNKKEKDERFEECWIAYNRKGSKSKSLDYWNKLSDDEKDLVLPHIRVYATSRERCYQKDFERYLRDKIFLTVVVKGNDTIYDPEQFSANEYRPSADGIFLVWDDKRKCLLFNGYIDQLNDGYTKENRPDGAKVACGMYEWTWSSDMKEWVKQ